MSTRLHALQGRINVTCPTCSHGLHVHGDHGCVECSAHLEECLHLYASPFLREAVSENPCASDSLKGKALRR